MGAAAGLMGAVATAALWVTGASAEAPPIGAGYTGALAALECPSTEQFMGGGILEAAPGPVNTNGPATASEALGLLTSNYQLSLSDFQLEISTPDHVRYVIAVNGQRRLIANVQKLETGWVISDFAACDSILEGRGW